MHNIGDKVLYGASGVMTIVDIREESFGDQTRSYYVLNSTIRRSDSLTYVPADNEQLVSAMRPLLTKDEIFDLVRRSENMSPMDWIPENRARSEHFKRVMESGDREKMIAMILAIDESAKRREAEGKKNFLTDENAKQKAQRLLQTEMAVVFDIPEEDVKSYLQREIK